MLWLPLRVFHAFALDLEEWIRHHLRLPHCQMLQGLTIPGFCPIPEGQRSKRTVSLQAPLEYYQPLPAYLSTIFGNKPDIGPNLKCKVPSSRHVFVCPVGGPKICCDLYLLRASIMPCTVTVHIASWCNFSVCCLYPNVQPIRWLYYIYWAAQSTSSQLEGSWGGWGLLPVRDNDPDALTELLSEVQENPSLMGRGLEDEDMYSVTDGLFDDWLCTLISGGFRQTSYPEVEAVMRNISLPMWWHEWSYSTATLQKFAALKPPFVAPTTWASI